MSQNDMVLVVSVRNPTVIRQFSCRMADWSILSDNPGKEEIRNMKPNHKSNRLIWEE
jgi:hypothetical protein